MNKGYAINGRLMIVLFWTLIALILVFQLLSVDEYNGIQAVIYSAIITGTFIIFAHLVIQCIIRKYIQVRKLTSLLPKVFLRCVIAATVLTLEDRLIDNFFFSDPNMEQFKGTIFSQFFGMLLAVILISGVTYAFESYQYNIKTLENAQVLKDRLNDLEVKSIRQQLSPHFTFNILNNLQFLIQKDKDEALRLLSQYSKILRYYVYESRNKAILLTDEVDFLKTYLELEKDRLRDEATVEVDFSIEPNVTKIAPFILSTFVENCFKHVSAHNKWIYISIHYQEKHLLMEVKNTFDQKVDKVENIEGVGLEQVRKRLQLIYPDKHTLEFDVINNIFSVNLDIKFD